MRARCNGLPVRYRIVAALSSSLHSLQQRRQVHNCVVKRDKPLKKQRVNFYNRHRPRLISCGERARSQPVISLHFYSLLLVGLFGCAICNLLLQSSPPLEDRFSSLTSY